MKRKKDMKPAYREGREGPNMEEIAKGASKLHKDEIQRQILRGDESKGDPDARDVAGAPRSKDTPHGREEAKHDKEGAANVNG